MTYSDNRSVSRLKAINKLKTGPDWYSLRELATSSRGFFPKRVRLAILLVCPLASVLALGAVLMVKESLISWCIGIFYAALIISIMALLGEKR